jgi:Ras-related protein Rab-28
VFRQSKSFLAPRYRGVAAADLGHLRTVKPQRHKEFADSHGMSSFFVSAKSGDNVASTFYQLAAELAGVAMTKPELQIASKVVPATIINHPQNDPSVMAPSVGPRVRDKKRCVIM